MTLNDAERHNDLCGTAETDMFAGIVTYLFRGHVTPVLLSMSLRRKLFARSLCAQHIRMFGHGHLSSMVASHTLNGACCKRNYTWLTDCTKHSQYANYSSVDTSRCATTTL